VSDYNRDNNRVVWFDIPVADLQRAATFYAQVLGCKVETMSFNDTDFAVIENADGNGGCLVVQPDWISSSGGPLLYMNVHGRLRDAVEKTTSHGGTVVQDTHAIGPHGFRAIVLDSEGNRIALHSEDDA
jgi:predicted enzyme related to lactoylglutathione lyase